MLAFIGVDAYAYLGGIDDRPEGAGGDHSRVSNQAYADGRGLCERDAVCTRSERNEGVV